MWLHVLTCGVEIIMWVVLEISYDCQSKKIEDRLKFGKARATTLVARFYWLIVYKLTRCFAHPVELPRHPPTAPSRSIPISRWVTAFHAVLSL